MNWVDAEFALVAIAAMLSPLTLTWSVLALVLSREPLRTGLWFYAGALVATLAVGVAVVFVLGNAAASHTRSTPKTGSPSSTSARVLDGARNWLERHASVIAAVIVFVLAASLLRGGIAGLAS